ncbi:MAG: DUF2239 family protein [Candidatus Obscuribacterales bacterium]|jgi:hypothetical protein
MNESSTPLCTAFAGSLKIAGGDIIDVAIKAKEAIESDNSLNILIFDDLTSMPIEIDWRGTVADVEKRVRAANQPSVKEKGPGRPKLGVVSREVTLLPRHWEWLNSQAGGASVALRKLVEEARKSNSKKDTQRQSHEATYRFMSAMAGNLPNFEEATRALFAADLMRFQENISNWPIDLKEHLLKISANSFEQ